MSSSSPAMAPMSLSGGSPPPTRPSLRRLAGILMGGFAVALVVWLVLVKEQNVLEHGLSGSPSLRNEADLASLRKRIEALEKASSTSSSSSSSVAAQSPSSSLTAAIDERVKQHLDALRAELLLKQQQQSTPPPTQPKIDDVTACSHYQSRPVPRLAFDNTKSAKQQHTYEFVRIGVSDACVPGKTDVSVFFTLQGQVKDAKSDCQDDSQSRVAVRFGRRGGAGAGGSFAETQAQLVGCFAEASGRSWRFFAARMSALDADQQYHYTLEHEKDSASPRSFYSPPLPGARDADTHILFVGDTRLPDAGFVLAEAAKVSNKHDLVVHVGDGTYGTNDGSCYGQQRTRDGKSACGWDCEGVECDGAGRMGGGVMDAIRKWTAAFDESLRGGMAWMTTMGNHDNDLQWFLSMRPTCASALPGVHPDDVVYSTSDALQVFAHSSLSLREIYAHALDYMKSPHFYSFDYGQVHVVSLGSEDNPMNAYESWDGQPLSAELQARFDKHYGQHSKQYKWLVKDLSSVRRDVVPWVVVFTHRPLYSTAAHHPNCQAGGDWYVCQFRDTYEPLFRQFGVDVVVSGHSHHYARSHRMYKGKLDAERGTTHVVIGVGGFDLANDFHDNSDTRKWMASRHGTNFGYARMVVTNATHARWTHHLTTGRVFDDAWLVRPGE